MSSIHEEMSSEQKKRAKKMMGQLTQNPIAKSSGAGALSPEAAEQLGDKAKELRKKKLAKIGLPTINKEEVEKDALENQVMKPEHRNPKGTPKKVRGGDPRSVKENNYDWRAELEEAHWDPVTKKITDKKRTGSDPEIQKMAKRAASSGPKKRVPLGQGTRNTATSFNPSSREEAKENKRRWDEYWEGSSKSEEYTPEEFVIEAKGISREGALQSLHNHQYSKQELWNMQKKATEQGDHGMASALYSKWKEMKEEFISEEEMTDAQKKKESELKDKYDASGMKQNMIDQYGKKKGTQIYFAKIRKMAMEEETNIDEVTLQLDEIAPLVAGGLALGGAALGAMALNKAKSKVDSAIDKARKTSPIGGDRYANQLKQLRQSFDYEDVYNYIMEMFVEYDFAEDYESAEVIFENISDEFTAALMEEYLEEKARGTRKKKTAHIYDMDETLYGHDHSKVRVHVNDASGKRVQSLSNQEFNTHKLPKDHKYDFSEFGSSKTFQKSAKPLKKMIKHMKRQKARGYDTHIVTARSDFDDKHHLAKQLKKHGVDITPNKKGSHTHLHRSGNEEGTDVGKKKQKVLSRLAQRHGYSKIHMYDDAEKVHQATHGKTPGVKVKGHMVKPNKSGEVYSRPYKPTKPKGGKNNSTQKEQTAYEYWKQFIN